MGLFQGREDGEKGIEMIEDLNNGKTRKDIGKTGQLYDTGSPRDRFDIRGEMWCRW